MDLFGFDHVPHSHAECEGLVVKLTPRSLLFFSDVTGQEAFIPFSQIADWWFTERGDRRTFSLQDLEPDDEITVVVPKWLLRKEYLI
jgi:hypothetical protein